MAWSDPDSTLICAEAILGIVECKNIAGFVIAVDAVAIGIIAVDSRGNAVPGHIRQAACGVGRSCASCSRDTCTSLYIVHIIVGGGDALDGLHLLRDAAQRIAGILDADERR